MFRNWEAWLGRRAENGQVEGGEECAAEEKGGNRDINKHSAGAGGEQITPVQDDPLLQQTKGLSGESVQKFLGLKKLVVTYLDLRSFSTTGYYYFR